MSTRLVLDAVLRAVQEALGHQLQAGYLTGSQEDGTAVANSDIDLVLVFKEELGSDQRREAKELEASLSREVGVQIDFDLLYTTTTVIDPALKLGGRLWFGAEIRDRYPLIPIEDWGRDRLHTSYWRSVKLFKRPPHTRLPLAYPADDDPFYGYVIEGHTRELVRHVSWAATALIAHNARRYVVRKSEFVTLYRELINDEWSEFLERVYTRCKLEWNYRIPEPAEELRTLCQQTLGFENHVMKVYRGFLLDELQSDRQPDLLHTLWVLERLPLQDDEVRRRLEALTEDPTVGVRDLALAALAQLN